MDEASQAFSTAVHIFRVWGKIRATGVQGVLNMLVECHNCEGRVDCKELADSKTYTDEGHVVDERVVFVKCPRCLDVLVARESMIGIDENGDEVYSPAVREWPAPDLFDAASLPKIVAVSLQEARKCFKAGCFLASTVMCGRSLEGVCFEYKTKSKNLSAALDELLGRDIIDKKLHEWGHATRTLRNLAAHATEEEISKEDAQDLLEFTKATCDYVFVLTKRFEEFKRRNATRAKPGKPTLPASPAQPVKAVEPKSEGATTK